MKIEGRGPRSLLPSWEKEGPAQRSESVAEWEDERPRRRRRDFSVATASRKDARKGRRGPSSSHSASLRYAAWAPPSPTRGEGFSPAAAGCAGLGHKWGRNAKHAPRPILPQPPPPSANPCPIRRIPMGFSCVDALTWRLEQEAPDGPGRRSAARPRQARRLRPGPDRPHADAGGQGHRHRPVPPVPQAGEPEPRRLDQGPGRPLDDRGGGGGRQSQAGGG